jgi:peptide deformylase
LKLFFFGSESLGQSEYEPVVAQAPEELKFIHQVESEMLAVINQFGIPGLAAPQLGYNFQMIVVKLAGGSRLTLLNPRIEKMYGAETEYSEGCISFPPGGNVCKTPRMQFINVVGRSIEEPGRERDFNFTSADARVVQHEIDHLNGTFFFDRANLMKKAKVLDRFHQWKRTFKNGGCGFPLGGGSTCQVTTR